MRDSLPFTGALVHHLDALHPLTETPSIPRNSDILPRCSASLSQRLPFTGALIHYLDTLHPLPRDSLPFTGALVHYPNALHPLTETPSIPRSCDILPGCPASPSQRLSPIYRSSGTLPGYLASHLRRLHKPPFHSREL